MSPYSVSAAGFHASAAWMLWFMCVSTLGAVTPTNRYGSAGPSPAAKPRAAERPRMIVSAGDGEGRAQARDLEDLAGRGLEPPQLDAAAALAGPLLDQAVELVAQRRRGGHVDLALDDDRWPACVVTDRDPKVIARGRV